MADEPLLVRQDDDGVLAITLNRPEAANALTPDQRDEIIDLLAGASEQVEVRAVVLGATGRHFCTGADLRTSRPGPTRPDDAPARVVGDVARLLERGAQRLVGAVLDCEKPVLAAVNGTAAGLGAHLALACDLVIAAKSAKFIQSFSALGLIPDSGGSWHLPRLVGQARALGMALTGEPLPAERAAEWGLIWKAVEDDQLDAEVDALAVKLASLPPLGLAAIKQIIRTSWARSLDDELDLQRDEMRRLGFTLDYREGVAAFLEKRPAKFLGR